MATEKDIALVDHVAKLSQEGKLKWEPTARSNEFTASIRGKYNILVRRGSYGWRSDNDPEFNLKLTDQSEQELLSLTERDLDRVADLFEMARRSSLKVDAIIDEIMHEEGDPPF